MAFGDQVQITTAAFVGTSDTEILTGVTAGNFIVTAVSGTVGFTSVADDVNAGNYTESINEQDNGTHSTRFAYKLNVGAGDTTFTCTMASSGSARWGPQEVDAGTGAAYADDAGATGSSSTPDSGSVTKTASVNGFFFGCTGTNGGSAISVEATGFTNTQNAASGRFHTARRASTDTSDTYDPTFTASESWTAVLIVFEESGGGPTTHTVSVASTLVLDQASIRTTEMGLAQKIGLIPTAVLETGKQVAAAIGIVLQPDVTRTLFAGFSPKIVLSPAKSLISFISLAKKMVLIVTAPRARTVVISLALSLTASVRKTTFKSIITGMGLAGQAIIPVFQAVIKFVVTLATSLIQVERPSAFSGHGGLGEFEKKRWGRRRATWRRRR